MAGGLIFQKEVRMGTKRALRRRAGFLAAAAALLSPALLPAQMGDGAAAIGLTLFFLALLVSEAMPVVVASLLTVGLMPVMGAAGSFGAAAAGFSHPVVFFILASFGIACALLRVPLPKRALLRLANLGFLRAKGGEPTVEGLLFAVMAAAACVSFFISNVPACAIMMAVALEVVGIAEKGPRRDSIGKTFMIAVPVATMIGGIATPASSSLNLLALGILYEHTGISVGFAQWAAVGVPMVALLLPFAWWLMVRVYRPAPLPAEAVAAYRRKLAAEIGGKFSRKERAVAAALGAMLALWVASSWVPAVDIFSVTLLGAVFLMLPGVGVVSQKQFLESVNWDVVFISGAVLSLAAAFAGSGAGAWLSGGFAALDLRLPLPLLVGAAALAAFAALLVFTSAPALISILAAPYIAAALAAGAPPQYLMIALAICAGNCYLLPLDTVQLLTYSKGYYRMSDMARSTVFLQLAIVFLLSLWLPAAGRALGF